MDARHALLKRKAETTKSKPIIAKKIHGNLYVTHTIFYFPDSEKTIFCSQGNKPLPPESLAHLRATKEALGPKADPFSFK